MNRAVARPGATRRGDGASVVMAWVAAYTLGLPARIRRRRREEIAADLMEEGIDAVRRGTTAGLARRRAWRLVRGVPADVAWRLGDARGMARDLGGPSEWVPLTRRSASLLAIVAIGAAGGLSLVAGAMLTGSAGSPGAGAWSGWGPVGFSVGCLAVLAGILLAVPWPGRGLAVLLPGVLIGLAAAPSLWACWGLAATAVLVRVVEAGHQDGHGDGPS